MARGIQLFVRSSQFALTREGFASGLIPRLADFSPILPDLAQIRRDQIAAEFEGEFEALPSGGIRKWRKTSDFFGEKAPAKTLQRTGRMLRALLGRGAGGIERKTPSSITVGLDASAFPGANILRRGGRIGITPAMRGFILKRHGSTFRRGKKFIRIPARGFGGPTPETRERSKAALLRFLATGAGSRGAA